MSETPGHLFQPKHNLALKAGFKSLITMITTLNMSWKMYNNAQNWFDIERYVA